MTTSSLHQARGPRRPARLAVGIGDPERERDILPELDATGDFVVAERCLGADALLDAIVGGRVDAVLVAYDLHRLSRALPELEAMTIPRVLLVPDPDEDRWQVLRGIVLPSAAPPEVILDALRAAIRGEAFGPAVEPGRPPAPPPEPRPAQRARDTAPQEFPEPGVYAIAGGHGAPGRTFAAINLAAALGAVAPTVLVDADLSGASVAAYLDADPTRNLYMVAHAEPDSAWEWHVALEQECQPLDRRSPHARVLCGLPKPEMRQRLARPFLEGLLATLRREARYVVVDTGADLLGVDGAVHRAALGLADQVLLVTATDVVGLWQARQAFALLRENLRIDPIRVALVLNRHDARFHHSRAEIEWALGASTAAVIPYDHSAVQRSLAAQRPLVLDRSSRAGRGLLELAGRVHGGKLVLPPEPDAPSRRGVQGLVERVSSAVLRTA